MFQSYEFIDYLGYDEATKQRQYQYKIIDTDFEDVAVGAGWVAVAVASAIIDCYSKRNLPVAPNLFRGMLYIRDKCGWTIDQQVEWNKQYNPRWKEIEDDMQMYLMFS